MNWKKILKKGLVLGGVSTAAIISSLIFMEKNEADKKCEKYSPDSKTESVNFDDLNHQFVKDEFLVDDEDIDL